jgi:hypothetical protein
MKLISLSLFAMFVFGCATAPQVVYVTDAQEVTAQALEPVSIDGVKLREEISKTWASKLTPDKAEAILSMVSEQIARTKRFTIEKINISTGKNYIIEPHIEEIKGPDVINIPTDPTRKKVQFKARVRLDVKSIEPNGTERKHKSFGDLRVNEIRVTTKEAKELPNDRSRQSDLVYETVEVGFKAAANSLGMAFNPSFAFGSVTKVNGRIAHISIDTSKLAKMPAMKRKVDVIDAKDQNKVIAVIEGIKVDNGSITGTIFEKSGSVSEGSKVRAQLNDLQE